MVRSKSQAISILTTLFALTAFILMTSLLWLKSARCNFVQFVDVSGSDEPLKLGLGIWAYDRWSIKIATDGTTSFTEECHSYPSTTNIDTTWTVSRAFTIITFILGIIALIITLFVSCLTVIPSTSMRNLNKSSTSGWDVYGGLYLLVAICQGLTLLIFNSNACNNDVLNGLNTNGIGSMLFEDRCRMATGSKLVIIATSFWVATGLTSIVTHFVEKKEIVDDNGGVVERGSDLTEPLTAAV